MGFGNFFTNNTVKPVDVDFAGAMQEGRLAAAQEQIKNLYNSPQVLGQEGAREQQISQVFGRLGLVEQAQKWANQAQVAKQQALSMRNSEVDLAQKELTNLQNQASFLSQYGTDESLNQFLAEKKIQYATHPILKDIIGNIDSFDQKKPVIKATVTPEVAQQMVQAGVDAKLAASLLGKKGVWKIDLQGQIDPKSVAMGQFDEGKSAFELQKEGLEVEKLKAEIGLTKAKTAEAYGKGTGAAKLKPLPSKIVEDLNGDIALPDLLKKSAETVAGVAFRPELKTAFRSRNPYDVDAQTMNSVVVNLTQRVGRVLEGGVLRKEDELKYKEMLGHPNSTNAKRINEAWKYMQTQAKTNLMSKLETLEASGYNVEKLKALAEKKWTYETRNLLPYRYPSIKQLEEGLTSGETAEGDYFIVYDPKSGTNRVGYVKDGKAILKARGKK